VREEFKTQLSPIVVKEAKTYHEKQLKIDKDIQQRNSGARKPKELPTDAITVNTSIFPKLNENEYKESMETLYRSNDSKEHTINLGNRKVKMHKFVLVI